MTGCAFDIKRRAPSSPAVAAAVPIYVQYIVYTICLVGFIFSNRHTIHSPAFCLHAVAITVSLYSFNRFDCIFYFFHLLLLLLLRPLHPQQCLPLLFPSLFDAIFHIITLSWLFFLFLSLSYLLSFFFCTTILKKERRILLLLLLLFISSFLCSSFCYYMSLIFFLLLFALYILYMLPSSLWLLSSRRL